MNKDVYAGFRFQPAKNAAFRTDKYWQVRGFPGSGWLMALENIVGTIPRKGRFNLKIRLGIKCVRENHDNRIS